MDLDALRSLLQHAIDHGADARLIIDGCDLQILPAAVDTDDKGNLKVTTRSPLLRNTPKDAKDHHHAAPADGLWLINPARVAAAWIHPLP